MTEPSMQNWENAWQNADVDSLKNQYSENAIVFPVNKKAVIGNVKLAEFFKGGFGKLDVRFSPEELIVEGNLAFETGTFKDLKKETEKIIGSGNYVINWILQNGVWKIKFHTWTISN